MRENAKWVKSIGLKVPALSEKEKDFNCIDKVQGAYMVMDKLKSLFPIFLL